MKAKILLFVVSSAASLSLIACGGTPPVEGEPGTVAASAAPGDNGAGVNATTSAEPKGHAGTVTPDSWNGKDCWANCVLPDESVVWWCNSSIQYPHCEDWAKGYCGSNHLRFLRSGWAPGCWFN